MSKKGGKRRRWHPQECLAGPLTARQKRRREATAERRKKKKGGAILAVPEPQEARNDRAPRG
jgi:hypothetical protein